MVSKSFRLTTSQHSTTEGGESASHHASHRHVLKRRWPSQESTTGFLSRVPELPYPLDPPSAPVVTNAPKSPLAALKPAGITDEKSA